MAAPERYISIQDFRAGIWGDQHAATPGSALGVASSELAGALPQNGAARVEGTSRCRADKTGALVPLPKAIFDESTDGVPSVTATATPYLLDAQVGVPESVDAVSDTPAAVVYTLWGHWDSADDLSYVRGRQYRPKFVAQVQRLYDFLMVKGTVTGEAPLPAGSLCNTRFYYGATSSGVTEAAADDTFRVRWWYPVVVALVASPAGLVYDVQRHVTGTNATAFQPITANNPAGGSTVPYAYWSPSVGGEGNGGVVLAMNFNNGDDVNLPLDDTREDTWYFHYNDTSHAHLADLDEAMNNPYMVISHQQRVVMADRRLSAPIRTMYDTTISGDKRIQRALDDLLWYSDPALPMQDFDLSSPGSTYSYADDDATGTANTGYQNFPAVLQDSYHKLTVGDDQFSQIGTFGVVNYDQLFVVKHAGGGVVVAGDLDTPQVRRLPYIEPTGGLIMKGAQTPLGFVYGSPNGVFVWQGGEQTKKLSNQIDGFFWDHTDGTDAETYAGARGRFGYWNGLVLVPNNYVFDIDGGGWWRLGVTDLTLQTEFSTIVYPANPNAFSVYDTTGRFMFAFPYKAHDDSDTLVWYTYDPLVLDNAYTWQSHPLIETRGQTMEFQEVTLVSTAHKESAASIKVRLEGFDVDGGQSVAVEVTFDLAQTDEPQLLKKDIPAFAAEYVTVSVEARSNSSDIKETVDGTNRFSSVPAPKIHAINLGVKDRAHTRRHG